MKSFLKSTLFIFGIAFGLLACDGQLDSLVNERLDENPPPDTTVSGNSGQADFTNYVAIGNSLTAGFMDGALYNLGQENSMPSLLAQQLRFAGAPETFNQPDINSEKGFNTSVENPVNGTVLGRFKLDTNIPGPSPTLGGDPITSFGGATSSLNNFGVPGIVVGQLLTPATGGPQSDPAFNPFYARFASSPGSSTILGDAITTQPTFFTLWIGNNDVLGYAVGGASNPALLTSISDFNTRFNAVINSLMSQTMADGVVANIPPILAIPFFRAVPYNAITLDEQSAQQLNTALAPVNAAFQAVVDNLGHPQADADRRKMNYSAGNNPILVIDEELEDLGPKFDQLEAAGAISPQQRAALVPYEQSRPLTSVQGQPELVLISAGSLLGTEADGDDSVEDTPIGVVIPLGFDLATGALNGDQFYLSLPEQQEIEQRRAAFNQTISNAVDANSDRLALYDTNSPASSFADLFGLSDGQPGITVNGVDLNPDFSPNGVFSTDGVHPNPRGNAIIANDIIQIIENNFNARIPEVEVLSLPSVQICAGDCVSQQSKGL